MACNSNSNSRSQFQFQIRFFYLIWKSSATMNYCRLMVICKITLSDTEDVSKHDDVIKCKHFPRYWPFVRGIHRSSIQKGQWRGALVFTLICVWINGSVSNHEAGDLRRYRAHYDITVMRTVKYIVLCCINSLSVSDMITSHRAYQLGQHWRR